MPIPQEIGPDRVMVRGRLAFLDSLRGWAAIYVIFYHTALIPTPGLHLPTWAAPVVLTGGTGVTLFFVVSAFSLCRAACPGEESGQALAAFAARRFFRIAPLFYIVLLASLLRDHWVFNINHEPNVILANVVFLFNVWPGHEEGIAWASWTIGVEVLFYAIFPALVARARTLSMAAAYVLLTLLIAGVSTAALHYIALPPTLQSLQDRYGLLHHLPVFTFGILAYRIFERLIAPKAPSREVGAALLLGAAYLYTSLLNGSLGPAPFLDAYYWQAIIYGAVLLGLAIYPAGLIVNWLTMYLGKISYSLYLIHPAVVFALIPFYRSVEAHGWPATISFGICIAATLSVVITLATMTYILVEAPGIRIGARLIAFMEQKSLSQAAAT